MAQSDFSSEALKLLDAFCGNANIGQLHPGDWERWHEFVIRAHHDRAPVEDVSYLLRERWPKNEYADQRAGEMGGDYYEKRQLLAAYDMAIGR